MCPHAAGAARRRRARDRSRTGRRVSGPRQLFTKREEETFEEEFRNLLRRRPFDGRGLRPGLRPEGDKERQGKSGKVGALTVTISKEEGVLKHGDEEFTFTFRDAAGKAAGLLRRPGRQRQGQFFGQGAMRLRIADSGLRIDRLLSFEARNPKRRIRNPESAIAMISRLIEISMRYGALVVALHLGLAGVRTVRASSAFRRHPRWSPPPSWR